MLEVLSKEEQAPCQQGRACGGLKWWQVELLAADISILPELITTAPPQQGNNGDGYLKGSEPQGVKTDGVSSLCCYGLVGRIFPESAPTFRTQGSKESLLHFSVANCKEKKQQTLSLLPHV